MANQQQFDTFKIVVEGTINTGAASYTNTDVNGAYNTLISSLQGFIGAHGVSINQASYHSTLYPKNGDTITYPQNIGAN